MKSVGVWGAGIDRVKKILLFYQKTIYKTVKILYNIIVNKKEAINYENSI